MEQNTTGETGSTNDSQDVSSSQQDSTASDGQYCYDDANSTSSVHDEVVNSAIMEVSGELMLGKFSSHKHPSAGSESSDISDDDGRRGTAGGSIAKYPESSTGLSDNDWNPYATESDTNHTPRSPRSNASDDQNRIGFISKASINIAPPEKFKDSVATISMATGAVTEGSGADRVLLTERQQLHSRTGDVATRSEPKSDRLDILRYMVDRDDKQDSGLLRSQQPGFRDGGTEPSITARQSVESVASTRGEDISQSPDTVRSLHTDGSRSERQSIESGRSDEYRRESAESTKSFHSDGSGRSSGRSNEYRRESAESVRSLQSDGTGSRSGRQSTESGRSGRSSRSDLDRSGESNMSGRHSTESHHSVKSDHSRRSEQSQKSTARSAGSDRSDRLDRLSDAGDNIKELIQFESAQRFSSMNAQDKDVNGDIPARVPRDGSGDSVTHIRLSAKLEPYTSPTRSARSPERSQNRVGATGYVSVAERERLVSESPELNQYIGREDRKEARPDHVIDYERSRPVHSSVSLSRLPETLVDRSPSEISMRRVSNLFEETKKQVRAAVAIPRPEPSGSEERFPLQERLSVLQHDSFRSEDKSGLSDKNYGRKENLRGAETALSINSEEVARVLGRYAENDLEVQHRQAPAPTMSESEPKSDNVKVSAFERVDKNQMEADGEDSVKVSDMSDDEIAKRVRAILSETDHLGVVGGNGRTLPQGGQPTSTDYVPRTIDYSRLQRDLQEIQDSLHDVPPPQANDSLYLPSRQVKDMAQTGPSPVEDQYKSLESTCMTLGGRDSGASEYGRKLVWDHGADLQYDVDYTGQFMGTTTSSSETLTQTLKRFGTGDSNSLGVRPDSAATIGSERDALDLESEGSKTLTGSDITRAEKIVDQVLNRRAEGDLQENVEDIIARYRNERRDLFDRLQPATSQPSSDSQQQHISQPAAPIISHSNYLKRTTPTLNDKPDIAAPSVPDQPQKGLAARVYKILTSEPNTYQEPDSHNEKGMAKTVYKILSEDRPQQQVNGILSDAMAEEHEMLKKLVSRPKDDSSMDDSGLNETAESFGLEDRDVRKQLEWSQMSSPEKRDKSGLLDLNAIKQVISAPYSAVSNAKTLLSSQLKKMSERNFDKTIELRTPYRQAIDCYPVYGVERSREPAQEDVREAWMPRVPDRRPTNTSATKERALANDRFFLTEKDRASEFPAQMQTESPRRQRTYSDPFEVSPSRRTASTDRVVHSRCKSEEAADVGDLSQYSVLEPEYSPTERRAASSPRNFRPGHDVASGLMMTPDQHRPQDSGRDDSPTESDSSGSKRPTRLRPYRPAGSREVYYVESGDETNESGTTVESTHIGSDDAIPPYIPSQYLGTRKDEPMKHPNGIYGNKDALSTIDENSVKDDKEKALSVSTGSGGLGGPVSTGSGGLGGPVGTGSGGLGGPAGRDDPRITDGMRSGRKSPHARSDPDSGARSSGSWHDTRDARTSDTGYQTSTRSRSPYSERDNLRRDELYPSTNKGEQLEGPGFKTREQFQQDFERRERELKHALSGRHSSDSQEQLGASVRSDPGGQLDDHGPRWEYRDTEEASDFRRLEPEPAYPQERLRCSRSKSDTDLVALSPTESQKYSSPMQPGTRFLELSTQPSPIFSHHDSLTYQQRGAPMTRSARDPPELPKVPIERELRPAQHPRELPIVDDRRRSPSPLELPVTRDQPVRPLERGNPGVQPLVPGDESNLQGRQRSTNMMDHVELGVDPRRMGGMRTASQERLMNERSSPVERSKSPVQRSKSPVQRSKSPLQVRQKEMEAELEKLNKQLSEQVNEIQEKNDESPEQFEDNFPPSKKAQVLREVLEQEYVDTLPPNLNDMWTRFKEKKDVSQSESSLNSTRMDALSGLLGNPTYHAVNSFIAEKNELAEKKKQEEREKVDKLREDRQKERERERKLSEVRAAEERSLRRQELMAKHGLSEEESNGSYTEILMEREKKKSSTKTDGRREQAGERKTKRSKSPDKTKAENKSRKDKENQRKGDKGTITDIRNRNKTVKAQHSDSIDTLFSIPEDASFEQSPTKSPLKSRQRRHRHVIDPLMMKLRDKIKLQRDKIDKERRKELQRVEKLKKLEMLLTAKQRGKLSDRAIDVELQDVSSTTTVTSLSESSTLVSDPNSTAISGVESETMSNDSTIDSIKLQVKQYSPETRVASRAEKRVTYRPETHVTSRPETHVTSRQRYVESDTTESDFSNIVVERIPEKRSSARKSSGKKEKKIKVDEYGNRIRKEKKDRKKKTEFSGVEMSEDVLAKQLRRYEKYMTPERQKVMQDVSTMYPSPISVSPPRRRKQREVLMKSASIQTSPSMRSSSPSHAYDEVPVAPVPLMSSKQSGRTARRRPSSSPPRSSQTSPSRKPSKSPPRKSSRSPAYRRSSRSPSAPVKRSGPPPMPRKVVESPMWKPETDSPPPDNSMFTPENGDENTEPVKLGHEAQTWFIPLKPSQPWRQPLKERQAFSVRQEQWEPKSVSQSTWKNIVHGDILKDKGDPNDISRDTKFDLDPEGQPIRDEDSMEDSDDTDMDISKSKPLSKMSLQEAFLLRKQDAISRLRERQKRLNFAAEDRKMEAFLKLERDKLFTEERRKEANPDAHPYSDHLHKPARRVISKEEMKEMSTKRYKKLPEILEKEKLKKRSDSYSLNRIKARLFNRKIQKKVLIKAEKWGR